MPAITLARPTLRPTKATARPARRDGATAPGFAWASLFLLVATAAYLCVELPFAAHLVDILSTSAAPDEIHAAERTGRLVSGAALALALWGWMLRPRKPVSAYRPAPARKPVATAMRLALVAVACVGGMMVGQRSLIDRVATLSDAGLRQAALKGAVLRHALIERPAAVTGMAVPPDAGRDPSWSAFLGSIPALSAIGGDAFRSLRAPEEAVAAYVASGTSLRGFRKDVYEPAILATRDGFRQYRDGVRRLSEGRRDGLRQMDETWNEIAAGLRSNGIRDPGQPHIKRQVGDKVRARGIPVPDGWDPRDRATYEVAFMRQLDQRIETSYVRTIEASLGEGARLPLNLTRYEDFLAFPAVQDSLRRNLNIDKGPPTLKPSPSDAELSSGAYLPARAAQTRLVMEALTRKPGSLKTNARLDGPSEDAVRLAVAPALALILSAIGAFGHMAKMLHHLLGVAGATAGLPALLRLCASALLMAVLVASVSVPSTVSATAAWKSAADAPQAKAVGWAMGAHGLIHPLGTALSALPGLRAATWAATRSGLR